MSAFSETYREARTKFLEAAGRAGATLVEFRNDCALDPFEEPLCTDVAWIGPDSAETVLFTVSGVHGVEGYAGSAAQVELLRGGLRSTVPDNTALLLVHALNPYGFAYDRRVNEDNVDLNRNFVDHARRPDNERYPRLHSWLVPSAWTGPGREVADAALLALAADRGLPYLQEAVTSGQWSFPDGLFYGGTRPVWSNRVLSEVVRRYLPGRRRVAYIDLHTGLGPRGVGEPIFRGGDPGALARACRWYGPDLTRSDDGTSSSTPIVGNSAYRVAGMLDAETELTAITLEFGTLPGIEVLEGLRADNWLNLHTEADPATRKVIKQQVRRAFYLEDDPEWTSAVLCRADEVFSMALAGLRN